MLMWQKFHVVLFFGQHVIILLGIQQNIHTDFHYQKTAPKLYNSQHLFSMSHACHGVDFGESKTETDRFIYDISHTFMVAKSVSIFEGSSLNLMCGMFGRACWVCYKG
jgi:hypothetical protein